MLIDSCVQLCVADVARRCKLEVAPGIREHLGVCTHVDAACEYSRELHKEQLQG